MDFSQLAPENSLIVTASRRQARFIREQYQEYQIQQGKSAWHSLSVMPWSAFIDKCWGYYTQTSGEPVPVRLNTSQSQYLWQQLVLNSGATQSLLNSQQTVKQSYAAWRMMCQWQVDDFSFINDDSDQEAFAEWYFEYRKLLQKENWLDTYQVASIVADQLPNFQSLLPETLCFYGFQQVNPQQQAIINGLSESKKIVELGEHKSDSVIKSVTATDSSEQEFIVAIRWAIERLQKNSEQQIAILVPDLESRRTQLERIIQRELYPKELLSGTKGYHWHDISISESLLKQPMVELILTLFKLLDKSVTKAELQTLLLLPYLYNSEEEHWQATQLEVLIRQSNKGFYSFTAIKDLCFKQHVELSWLKTVDEWLDSDSSESQSYIQSIQVLLQRLESLHWSGYHALSSREYQLQQQFIEVVKDSGKLNSVVNKALNWSQALKVLQQYLQEQSFHQETPQAPIKVMGLLEAVAIEYDAVWLVSATDKVLPQKTSINPFLSKALQIKHQLPGSSHQRELQYAQAVLNSLFAKHELVFSYATHDGEQEQLVSPLLKPLIEQVGIKEINLDSELPAFIQNWPDSEQVESYQDEQGLAIETDGFTAGGTGLLKAQAASPFDAYLRYRLKAYPFETDDLGISFLDRGNLFHKVMQVLWQYLGTQQALLNHDEKELVTLVKRTITNILNMESKYLYLLNHEGFLQTETKRLKALVLAALELDKTRPSFEVIDTEAKREIEVGGLRLNITIDRIDRLEDGSLMIIDYKTGTPTLKSLLDEPIGEPQLLLYAVSEHRNETPVAGILFYQAHLKANKYIGFTESSEMIKGVKALKDLANNPYADDFAEAVNQWREALNQIAESFKAGHANVTDYSGNYTDHYVVNRWLERDAELIENVAQQTGGAANG